MVIFLRIGYPLASMKKVLAIGFAAAALSIVALRPRYQAPELNPASLGGPLRAIVPASRPALVLSLDDPGALLYGKSEREDLIQIMQEPPVVKATPTSGLIDTLSRFGMSVDDKRRPIVHYYFAKKMTEGQKAEDRERKY